jgi:outer membrane receptor for monomeric catechols
LGIGDYRTNHPGGDWVVDSRLAFQVTSKLEIQAIVKNLLNHIYMQRPADMQPPRTFVLQASMKF